MRTRVALAAVLALALLPATAHAGGPAISPGDLFVVNAKGGKVERLPGSARGFEVTLRRPARDVTVFSDRPARQAGERALRRFVRGWARLGFADEPPNAALVVHDAPSGRDVLVLELRRPRLGARGRTLIFRARAIAGNPGGALREFGRKADRKLPDRFGATSLFIDPSGQPQQLNLTLTNVPDDLFSFDVTNAAVITLGQGPGVPLTANPSGPAFVTFGSNNFSLVGTGPTPVNATVQLNVTVLAAATGISGTAIVPAGATATVRVQSSGKSFPITSGNFRIPLS